MQVPDHPTPHSSNVLHQITLPHELGAAEQACRRFDMTSVVPQRREPTPVTAVVEADWLAGRVPRLWVCLESLRFSLCMLDMRASMFSVWAVLIPWFDLRGKDMGAFKCTIRHGGDGAV